MIRGNVTGLDAYVELRDRAAAANGDTIAETRRRYLRSALGFIREAREEMADGVHPEMVAKTIACAVRASRLAPPASALPWVYVKPKKQQLALRGGAP